MADTKTPNRLDRRVIKTQKAIRSAFRKLIVEQGLGNVTVSALAREADIDRKTFYLHYSSIDNLFEETAKDLVIRVANAYALPASGDEASTHEGRLLNMREVLTRMAEIVSEDIELYTRISRSLSIDQMVEALFEPVRTAIANNPELPADVYADGHDYIVRFYLAGTISVFVYWLQNECDRPVSECVDTIEQAIRSQIERPCESNSHSPIPTTSPKTMQNLA